MRAVVVITEAGAMKDFERAFLQAERAEQRELAQPPRDCKRLRRIDKEPAGQQRDQAEHVEVDAIGARERVAALGPLQLGGELDPLGLAA